MSLKERLDLAAIRLREEARQVPAGMARETLAQKGEANRGSIVHLRIVAPARSGFIEEFAQNSSAM